MKIKSKSGKVHSFYFKYLLSLFITVSDPFRESINKISNPYYNLKEKILEK
jgi:hypothetical protein